MSLTRIQPSALDITLNYRANTFTANYITFGDGTTQTTAGGGPGPAFTQANSAYDKANSAGSFANGAFGQANSAASFANGAFVTANSAGSFANSAYTQANNEPKGTSAGVFANAAFVTANSAASFANSAFTVANNALPKSGGTITNDLTIQGNLSILGTSTTIYTTSLETTDSLIYLANNNITTDAIDIGIIGHYNDGTHAHSGIFRDPNLKEWIFFKGYTPELGSNNLINIAHPSFARDNIQAYTFKGNVIGTNITVTGITSLGNVGNVHITGGNTGQVLSTDNFGNLSFVDLPSKNTTTYTASTLTLTNGVYVSGSVTDVQVLNDGNSYQITDGTGTGPAWIITCTFTGVTSFNRVVANIDYTVSSGHIIYFQIYNNTTSTWDNIGSYSGASGYSQYALEVLGYSSYVSAGTVQARLYHSNSGNAGHATKLDYFALEQSAQGAQGPRGATGATGATGNGVVSGGTTGQVLIKNSSADYDTTWSDNLINSYNVANSASIFANAAFTQANNEPKGTSAGVFANAAFVTANSAASFANGAFTKANTDFTNISVTSGTYGSSSSVPVIKLESNGRISAISTATVTGGGGSSNSFSTILVSGQPNVIANTSTAPLTLVAGSGMTITTVGTSNTITFASTGGFSGGTIADQLISSNTLASTSNTTGSLIVTGGVGITGNLYTGNIVLSVGNSITFGDGTIQTTAGGTDTWVRGQSNAAFDQANSAASFANGSFGQANSAASFANAAFSRANSAYAQANTVTFGTFITTTLGWNLP